MSKPTPGPWHVGGTFFPDTPDAHVTVWSAAPPGFQSGDEIAKYVHPRDASLIAAAPDLLDTLQAIVNMIDAPHFSAERKYRIRNMAHAAISKATGEA